MNFLEEITYGTIAGTREHGLVGFEIVLSGNKPDMNTDEVADAIIAIKNFKNKFKNINKIASITLNDGINYPQGSGLYTFVKALSTMGYQMQAISYGRVYEQWFKYLTSLVVELKEDKTRVWTGFKCNELRFELVSGNDEEPIIPDTKPLLYVIPNPALKQQEVFKWIKSKKNAWNIMVPPKTLYKEVIYNGLDT
jgi:hypothetical protein